jgi:PEP-CTERM motif-containing protein
MNQNSIRSLACCTLAVFVTCCACVETALSAVPVYTNRSLWEAAVGPRSFTENFEGFTDDINFSFTTTNAPNGFSLSHTGSFDTRNTIDVVPLEYVDGNGTNGASIHVNDVPLQTVDIVPDFDLAAFGFEVSSAFSADGAMVRAIGPGGTILATANLTNGIDDFFGFQATGSDRIIRLEIRSRELNPVAGEGFYMDNFAGVFVPEPGTLVMLTLAVALIACRRSAKRYCGAD